MQALVVILIILLAAFVIVSTVLIVIAIGLSRDIAHAQRNIRTINANVDDVTTLTSVVSSVYGLWLKAKPKKKTARASKKDTSK